MKSRRYFFPLQGITLEQISADECIITLSAGFKVSYSNRTFEQLFTELMNAERLMSADLY